jgi:hypothetical protein
MKSALYNQNNDQDENAPLAPLAGNISNEGTRTRSNMFAPSKSRHNLNIEDNIVDFQTEYVSQIGKFNRVNADFAVLDYQKAKKQTDFDIVFNDRKLTPRNVAKMGVTVISFLLLILCGFVAFNDPHIKSALAQNVVMLETSDTDEHIISIQSLSDVREDIDFATNVTLNVRGESKTFDTVGKTVADVLSDEGVKVQYGDDVFPALQDFVGDNQQIYVDKMISKSEIATWDIPFPEQRIDDDTINQGEEHVQQEGVEGKAQNTVIIRQVAGQELSRQTVSSVLLSDPVDRIVKVGTKVAPSKPAAEAPAPPVMKVPDSEIKQYAMEQIKARGWDESEYSCLDPLWARESGWRVNAGNSGSGAYGIPQALPASKMASAGADYLTNPMTQVRWGLGYIAGRYGTPCNAWHQWQTKHWY